MPRLVLLVLLVACGGSSDPDLKKVLGTEVRPPFGLDKLRRGMSLADAEAAADLKEVTTPGSESLTKETGDKDIELEVYTGSGRVGTIDLRLRAVSDFGPFKAAWGPPTSEDKDRAVWIDAKTGWRAEVPRCMESIGCHLIFETYNPLDVAALGASPAIPAFLGKVWLGMTEEDRRTNTVPDTAVPLEYTGTGRNLTIDRGLVTAVILSIGGDATQLLTDAWGSSFAAVADGHRGTRWLDPATATRATLEVQVFQQGPETVTTSLITFDSYMPLAKLLGDGDAFTLSGRSLLGLTRDEVKAIAGEIPGARLDSGGTELELPASEWLDRGAARFEMRDDHVVAAELTLTARDEVVAFLKQKWRSWTPDPEDATRSVLREAGPRITATPDSGFLIVRVEDR